MLLIILLMKLLVMFLKMLQLTYYTNFNRKRKEINATKAPQVLVVNFDDAVSLSDDGEMSDSSSVDEQSPRLLSDFPQDLERTNGMH